MKHQISHRYVVVGVSGLPAQILAEYYLGLPFVDAADVMLFHHDGSYYGAHCFRLRGRCSGGSFVLPIASTVLPLTVQLSCSNAVAALPALLLLCLDADLYENWI